MLESLKKLMLSGLGAALISKEKAQALIDEMVAKGEVTLEEGKKLHNDITDKVDEHKEIAESKIDAQIQKSLDRLGVPNKERFEMLENRVKALEDKIFKNTESEVETDKDCSI